MSKVAIAEQFKVFFEKNKSYLNLLSQNFAEKHEEFSKFLNLYESNVFDVETEYLMQSFCFMLSRLDLKIDYANSLEARTVYSGKFPEFTRIVPAYAMTQFKVDTCLLEKALIKEVQKGKVFEVQNEFNDAFLFSSMSTKKILAHEIKAIKYFDKTSPLCQENFSHFEISLRLNLKDKKKLEFYINSSLENSFHILDQILNKNHTCYIITNNEKIIIPKSCVECSFNFDHYLDLKIKNNLYYLFDFFNYIKKHLFFTIDLTEFELNINDIRILIETTSDTNLFSSIANSDLFCFNVFPLINIFYKENTTVDIDEQNENNIFSTGNLSFEKADLICISSFTIKRKNQDPFKMYSLEEYFIEENRPDYSADFVWSELGWNFDKTVFKFQITPIHREISYEDGLYQASPSFIYSHSDFANSLTKNLILDRDSISDMNHIKQAQFLDFNKSFDSLFDSHSDFKSIEKAYYVDQLNVDVSCQNRDWISFLKEMLDILCLDSNNKLAFKTALQSFVWIKHELYDSPSTCPIMNIRVVKINNKYNGGIFLFDFLVKYLSMVNIRGLEMNVEFV